MPSLTALPDFRYRFDVILRAKKLGPRSKHIRRLRKAILIILGVFLPVYIIGNVLAALRIYQEEVYTGLYLLSALFMLLTLGVSVVLLIVISIWICKLDMKEKKNKKIRRIVRKNILIAVNNGVVVALIMPFVFTRMLIAENLPAVYYSTQQVLF